MNWYSNLYTGKTAEKKKESLIRKIEDGKAPFDTYLLTLPASEDNQLEVIPAWNLKFWYNRSVCPLIVGIGIGRKEMTDMICQIVQEVLEKTGTTDLRGYLEEAHRASESDAQT
jgi:hypothetical protein